MEGSQAENGEGKGGEGKGSIMVSHLYYLYIYTL